MIKIGNIIEVYDAQNAPETGARLVVQPDYYNRAFRDVPTITKQFDTAQAALNFFFVELGKAFFGNSNECDFAAIITGGTFYVDIITAAEIRKTFRVDSNYQGV